MNSKSSKNSKPHVLILNLTDKIYLRRGEKSIALSNLTIYCTKENIKITLKYLLQHGMMNLNWWIISYIKYSSDFENILKNHGENIDNLSIRIYVSKIENRITCKIETGYYLELLTPETSQLLGST